MSWFFEDSWYLQICCLNALSIFHTFKQRTWDLLHLVVTIYCCYRLCLLRNKWYLDIILKQFYTGTLLNSTLLHQDVENLSEQHSIGYLKWNSLWKESPLLNLYLTSCHILILKNLGWLTELITLSPISKLKSPLVFSWIRKPRHGVFLVFKLRPIFLHQLANKWIISLTAFQSS